MIKFRSKKWFDDYLAYRKQHPISTDTLSWDDLGIPSHLTSTYESTKHPIYALLQRSGLSYGFPVQYPFQLRPHKRLSTGKTAKLTLIDTLTQLVFYHQDWDTSHMPEKIDDAGHLMRTYYRNMSHHAPHDDEHIIEKLLQQR